ncbi:MAG: DNA-binding protein WhiA [Firmicutes bacterium]|nr:DNA-binding protein WhiA [Bacillota bacterium]
MSFSSDVKAELCGIYPEAGHCAVAEIAGIINTCGGADENGVRIQTENAVIAKKFFTLIKRNFNIQSQVSIKNHKKFAKSRVYCVMINEPEAAAKIADAAGVSGGKSISPAVVRNDCCKRAYIRGAFISGGSLSDPEKTYHLEFVNTEIGLLKGLSRLMASFGLRSKVIKRKSHYIAYLKEGENIVDLLNVMGAHLSLMNLENVRIVKDMRNSVNRMVNCETANLSKTVSAAQKQIKDIEFISKIRGLGFLSGQLEEAARARLEYPEANLKEIGAMLSPPVGKSGVNHRLRKICEIADSIRGGEL